MLEGLIVKAFSNFFTTEIDGRRINLQLPGKFRQSGDKAYAGDRVVVELDGDEGIITEILPRKSLLQRPPIANVDNVLIALSTKMPGLSLGLLDRLLVLIEDENLRPIIVINKIDLLSELTEVDKIIEVYRDIGYPVICTSALSGEGISELKEALSQGITVVAGPSGAGKSTLLNAISPDLNLATGAVSKKLKAGRHTTRNVELLKVEGYGFLADTPGFSNLDITSVAKERLGHCFLEFRELSLNCRFRGCLHKSEPDCAIKERVQGDIAEWRYKNYLTMLEEIEEWEERRY